MNWQQIKEQWDQYRLAAGERWPELDATALERVHGDRTKLMEALRERYGLTLEQAGRDVDRWADAVSDSGVEEPGD